MKQINPIITMTLGIVLLSACGSKTETTPTQNSALNSISNSNGKEKDGYMQRSLDSWLENDWTPTVEKDEKIRKKYMQKVQTPSSQESETPLITTKEQLQNNTSESLSKKSTPQVTQELKYVEKKNKYPTLQEYVDKMGAYSNAQKSDEENSNVKKMQSMPVIGK